MSVRASKMMEMNKGLVGGVGTRRAVLLTAFVGIGVAHAMHSFGETPSASIFHWLSDSVLALPLAFAAVLVGGRVASVLRTNAPLMQATLFGALLVPGSAVHSRLDASHVHGPFSLVHAASDASKVFFVVLPLLLLLNVRISRYLSPAIASLMVGATLFVPLQARVAAVAIPPGYQPFQLPMNIPSVLTGSNISLYVQESNVQVAPGNATKMWTYCSTPAPDTTGCSFPGPTIRRPSGQATSVTLYNQLPYDDGPLTMHLHGNHSTSVSDGQPDSLIPNGSSYTYNYDLTESGGQERAAFRWYHDHRMGETARNVYMGLAGMWILDDSLDNPTSSLNLPSGSYDVPMTIASRTLDANNQLVYTPSNTGTIGQLDLVNGVAQPYFNVEARKYRLRILDADNNEAFLLAFQNNLGFRQISTESGLLPAPISRTQMALGPAERAEIVVDFSGFEGQTIKLQDLNTFGSKRDVMEFKVGPVSNPDTSTVPSSLRPIAPAAPLTTPMTTRIWILGQQQVAPFDWTINGQTYDPNRIDAHPEVGTSERWIFINTTQAVHYMHIHDVDWRLIERISPDSYDPNDALAEQGFKETFTVRPEEMIIIEATFTDNLGRYVFHCHVLEHEDQSMMTQFEVVS
ncbi:MAG: multicopper oxidase family protein [Actinomycetota bacterium]